MTKARITVQAPSEHPDVLDIKDAMQQVIDFFDLLSGDDGKDPFVWNLTFAGTNSPFSAEAEAVSLDPVVDIRPIAAGRIREARDYFDALRRGHRPARTLSRRRVDAAKKMLKRNTRGIGITTVSFDNLRDEQIKLTPAIAALSLVAVGEVEKEDLGYLPAKRDRTEIGSVEGNLEDVGTFAGHPSIQITERKTGRKIHCRVDHALMNDLARAANFTDVWAHQRVIVRGKIYFDKEGMISKVIARDVKRVSPREMTLRDVEDPEFTSGLGIRDYLNKLREGGLG